MALDGASATTSPSAISAFERPRAIFVSLLLWLVWSGAFGIHLLRGPAVPGRAVATAR